MSQLRIALDVMGGDHAPAAVLRGALRACEPAGEGGQREPLDPDRLLLVGDEARIRAGLAEAGGDPGFRVLHASQAIGMEEKPAQALRAKPDSSIARGIGAVKAAQAGAFVSMGNTGAVVGAATLGLGTLPGVRRPGIAVTMDLTGRPVTILDMGANIAPKPQHLLQYAIMGAAYQRDCLGVERPRVGLLNIGEEPGKGTELLQEAHALLAGGPLAFVGNVEGGGLFHQACDVLVTDGFTGNVVLKLMEGMAGFMFELLLGSLAGGAGSERRAALAREDVARIQRKIDYSQYGGALLLGVAGIVVIGHGRSDACAVANALHQAAGALDADVNDDIVRAVQGTVGEAAG